MYTRKCANNLNVDVYDAVHPDKVKAFKAAVRKKNLKKNLKNNLKTKRR